jgi:hypothetical protein
MHTQQVFRDFIDSATHSHVSVRFCEVYFHIIRTLMIRGAPSHRIEFTWIVSFLAFIFFHFVDEGMDFR